MYAYIRERVLSDVGGLSDYITNKTKRHTEEEIVLIGGDVQDWKPYADYEIAHRKSFKDNNQGRELEIALPNQWANLLECPLLERRCKELIEKLIGKKTDYQFAVHWNKSHTNLHIHIIFSERTRLKEASEKKWDRDIYLTAEGKVARNKADRAKDEHGNVLPPIHRKGESKGIEFTAKNSYYTTHKFLQNCKDTVAKMWKNPLIKDKRHITNYLHTYHEGNAPQASAIAKEWNATVRQINQMVATLKSEGYKFNKNTLRSQLVNEFYPITNGVRPREPRKMSSANMRTVIGKLATNYDVMHKKEQEQLKYMQEVVRYYVKTSIDKQVSKGLSKVSFLNLYRSYAKDILKETQTPKNSNFEHIINKNKIDMAYAKDILANDELTKIITERIHKYQTFRTSEKQMQQEIEDFVDTLICQFNPYCNPQMQTYAEQHAEQAIVAAKQAEMKEKIRLQRERIRHRQELERQRQAEKAITAKSPTPTPPPPEQQKQAPKKTPAPAPSRPIPSPTRRKTPRK